MCVYSLCKKIRVLCVKAESVVPRGASSLCLRTQFAICDYDHDIRIFASMARISPVLPVIVRNFLHLWFLKFLLFGRLGQGRFRPLNWIGSSFDQ